MGQKVMKIVTVIPARIGSTRFPEKPLFKLGGKELIAWVIEGAKQSKLSTEVIVATDDQRIAAVAEKYGAEAVMTAPELASGTDRIWAAVKNLNCDVVINVQGDEPLVTGALIDRLAKPFQSDRQLLMATLAHDLSAEDLENPNAVKVLCDAKGFATYFSRFPIPYSRLKPSDLKIETVYKHVGMYGYTKEFLKMFCATPQSDAEKAESLEQLRALHLSVRIKVEIINEKLVGVDTPADAKRVETLLLRGGHR